MNHIQIRNPYLCVSHDSLPRPIPGIPTQLANVNQAISQMQLGLKPLIQARWLMWDHQGKDELRGLLKDVQNHKSIDLESLDEGSLHAVEHAKASEILAVCKVEYSWFSAHFF